MSTRDEAQLKAGFKPLVVAVAASAGDEDALQTFLAALPGRIGAALIVMLDLDRQRDELLKVIGARSQMPIIEVTRQIHLESDHVYIIPPDRCLVARDCEISVERETFGEPSGDRYWNQSAVDQFFQSVTTLASDGFAIVLRGAGSTGATGVQALRKAGAIVLMQEPEAELSVPRGNVPAKMTPTKDNVRLADTLVNLLRFKCGAVGENVDLARLENQTVLGPGAAANGEHPYSRHDRSRAASPHLPPELARSRSRPALMLEASDEAVRADHEVPTISKSDDDELFIGGERQPAQDARVSKKQLRSAIEELKTVNAELKRQLEAISQVQNDLQNLMAAADFGTLFLDARLCVRRFSEKAIELFDITSLNEGRQIGDCSHHLEYGELLADVRKALSHHLSIRREVRCDRGRWYELSMCVYRTASDEADGVVITFADITERRNIDDALREHARQLRQQKRLVELSREPIFVWELEGGIVEWNRGCEELYGYTREEAIGARKTELLRTIVPGSSVDNLTETLIGESRWSGELLNITKDGQVLTVETQLQLESFGDRRLVLESAHDVSERRAWEERQRMFLKELAHRVKNTLAVVQAIAHQTLRTSSTADDIASRFDGRLSALASAHDLLSQSNWNGAELGSLAQQLLISNQPEFGGRCRFEGEPVVLPVELAIPFGLLLHELTTNAVKYGSLSSPDGDVVVRWNINSLREGRILELIWRERGGPRVEPPTEYGFGSVLIEKAVPNAFVRREFAPAGMTCTIRVSLQIEPLPAAAIPSASATPAPVRAF